jgi:hypothetical protein
VPVPGPGAGCTLDVSSLDIVLVATAAGPGIKTAALPLSITPVLPGSTFYAQFAELDFTAGWVGTYTSNALSCTIGSF